MSDNGTELHDLNRYESTPIPKPCCPNIPSLNHEPRTILNLNVDYEGSEEEDSDEDVSDTEPSPGEIQFSLIRMLQCPDEFQDFDEAHLTLARVLSITPEGDDSVSLIYEMYQNLCEKHAERPQETETRSSLPLVTQVEDDDQNLARLHALGIALKDQYDREGQLSDLQRAIGCMMELVRLSDEDEPEFPERLAGLGTSLLGRFERLGTAQDLENAINYQRTAISLTVDAQPKLLSNLGFSLMRRFELLGRLDDLEDAINSQEQAMLAATTEDEDTPLWLTALGDSLILKFEYLSDLASVDRAIDLYERALQLDLDADRRSTILNNLGSALQRRFMHVKDLNNIDSAIKFQKEAVLLTSENHSNMPMWLTNLGNSLQLRFEHLGESKDINLAIIHQEHALRLLPKRHALRSGILNDLGNSLRCRFDRWGEPADIDRAVALLSESLSLSSGGHTSRPRILDNLGSALRQRFETRGVLLDIDQAITALGEAVSLSTEGHMDQAERLNHLGNAYATRFERLGELSDLEHAIKSHRKAVSLSTQDSAKTISILADLGSSLFTRFRLSHDMSDIDEAIVSQRESISLSNTELSVTPGLLNNLGTSLQFRYHRSNQLVDIDESISCLEKSIALTPDDHADKPFWLDNLCKSFRSRFERVGDLDDIEQAVDCQTRAVNLTPNSHTSRPDLLNCLADVLAVRCSTVPGRLADLDSIVDAYRQAASAPAGKPITRFRAAYSWAKMATLNGLSPLEAYKVALDVIPQVAWLGTSINRRYQELSSLGSVVTDAIANAISEREYNLALEWLEEGRSIVWRQLLQLRTPMDELRSVDAPKADRLEQIARALDQAGSSNSIKSMSQVAEVSLEQAAQNHRRLAEDWNKLLDEVRQITGFSDFLRPKKASELIKAAHDGPVIAINVQKESCDALVLLPGATDVSCIPLPSLTFEKAADAQKHLMRSLRLAGVRLRTERRPLAKPTASSPNQLEGVLDLLWTDVVKPILDHLNFLVSICACKSS
jgi:tetratricopeptide (TPR) repeat protein